MAKLNKIMPPRNTKIRGQDHLLAYITPEEAQLLMANGGTGEAGPMGIPSYPEPGMGGSSDTRSGSGNESGGNDRGNSDSGNDRGSDSGNDRGSDGGITEAQVDAMARAQQDLFGGRAVTHGLSDSQIGYDPVTGMPRGLETVVAPDGQLVTTNLAGLTEVQRQGLPLSMNIAGMMGSNPYAYEIEPVSQRVIGQIGTPNMGLLGQGINALTDIILGPPKTFEDLLARGAYTGINAPDMSGGRDGGSEPPVKPVNPATGQCDAGYMFDEDMQACRLDTRSSMGDQPSLPQVPFQPGGYARMGLLDEAPTNLPQFQQRYGAGFGSPSEFAAANTAFRQQSAYRPEYFKRPYPTDGYTLLS